jgi:ribokinase
LTDIRILIIGGASLDTLDGADALVAGGAGMYTALASRRVGADVTLFAPRPDPVPEALRPVAERLTWLGPIVAREELAHFEISYRGGQTTYVRADFGAEASLSPHELPADLSEFDCVHLVPLGNLGRQYEFLQACRERGARSVSAGTALDLINARPHDAQAMLRGVDFCFMNEEEARRIYGSTDAVTARSGQVIFITRGGDGATVVQGDELTHLPGERAGVVDPTGAGDTFCGATLAGLCAGRHPVMAARHAMPLSARAIERVGPAALLQTEPPPSPARDRRVVVNSNRISRVAAQIAGLSEVAPFPFTGADLPPPGHPATLDYFFASTLQQFGFWTSDDRRYQRPLVATIDGEERKGAFYLFRAYLRWLEQQPALLGPAAQAELTADDLRKLLRADDDSVPMPALELHLSLARQYGRDMLALGLTPQSIVERARSSPTPLRTLLQTLDHVGGYKEDPLRKKSALLAIILRQRPEGFLTADDDPVPPVVDYHVMRSCLRIGLVDVVDERLADRLVARELLSDADEWAIRSATHAAIDEVVVQSGKSMGAVDWFFFQARQRCPEMTAPRCDACAVDPVCAHRKELFQPVRRTSFY